MAEGMRKWQHSVGGEAPLWSPYLAGLLDQFSQVPESWAQSEAGESFQEMSGPQHSMLQRA